MTTEETVPDDLVARGEIPRRWPAITARLARRMTDERRVPTWLIGRRLFVSAADIDAWVAARRRPVGRAGGIEGDHTGSQGHS